MVGGGWCSVMLEGILLKPNMILPGRPPPRLRLMQQHHRSDSLVGGSGLDVPTPAPMEVARYTLRTMKRSVPAAVPGIHFLSGGMGEEEATLNLQALQAFGPTPWALTFSYGRALQSSTLKMWAGKVSPSRWQVAGGRC